MRALAPPPARPTLPRPRPCPRAVAAAATPDTLWTPATIVSNRAESADGDLRTLLLSVEDAAEPLSSRRGASARRATARWLDGYRAPGQTVRVCVLEGADGCVKDSHVSIDLPLACSPYDARKDSASLDAALVELLVDRTCGGAAGALGGLPPGALAGVGPVHGSGFAPLLERASDAGLEAAVEAAHPVLFVGAGAAGWGAVRAALEWAPVAAAAGAGRVSAVLAARDSSAAPYVPSFDAWRAAGVALVPAYTGASVEDAFALEAALFSALFGAGGAASTLGADGVVAVAGVPGRVAAALARRLADEGVGADRVLYPELPESV